MSSFVTGFLTFVAGFLLRLNEKYKNNKTGKKIYQCWFSNLRQLFLFILKFINKLSFPEKPILCFTNSIEKYFKILRIQKPNTNKAQTLLCNHKIFNSLSTKFQLTFHANSLFILKLIPSQLTAHIENNLKSFISLRRGSSRKENLFPIGTDY